MLLCPHTHIDIAAEKIPYMIYEVDLLTSFHKQNQQEKSKVTIKQMQLKPKTYPDSNETAFPLRLTFCINSEPAYKKQPAYEMTVVMT